MEEVDKGCLMIRMGVSDRIFVLVILCGRQEPSVILLENHFRNLLTKR